MQEFTVTKNESGQRVDRFIKKLLSTVSLGLIYKFLRKKKIKVNGVKVAPHYRLQTGDKVQFDSQIKLTNSSYEKQCLNYSQEFTVIFEDEHLLLVDKPAGLLIHADRPGKQNTLNRQVLSYLIKNKDYLPEKELTFKIGASNRLDRNTSGLVLFAKDYPSQKALNKMIREKRVEKYYLALVKGDIKKGQELKNYLKKNQQTNQVEIFQSQLPESQSIHTSFQVVRRFSQFTLLEVKLITGKPHQIRAQFAAINHPIIGDPKYGDYKINSFFQKNNNINLNRQFLHAYKIIFINSLKPLLYLNGKEFSTPLPVDLQLIENYLMLKF